MRKTETVLDTLALMAGMGVATFPLRESDKRPAITGWQECEVDAGPEAVAYYEDHRNANIAILCGTASGGLFAIDIDCKEGGADGFEYLRKWETEHGELPETATTKTGTGGMHMLYRTSAPVKTGANVELGIDVRGDGGYIVAPPSLHPNGRRYEWDQHPEDFGIADADENVMAFLRSIRVGDVGMAVVKPRFDLPEVIPKGSRDDQLFRYACSMQAASYGDEEIRLLVHAANDVRCKPPLPESEVEAKVAQALKYPKGKSIDLSNMLKGEGSAYATLAVNGKGAPLQTIDNCIRVLVEDGEMAGRWEYDVMSHCRTLLMPLPWCGGGGSRPVRDADYAELAAWMERKYGLNKKQHCVDAVMAVCERHKVNPLADWLGSLEWDGKPRMAFALRDMLGCRDDEYTRCVSSMIFLGGVARAVDAGHKFDYMPVLVGRQGTGKSTFVSRAAVRPEWYLDNLGSFDGDAAVEKIRGKWICEVAELAAFKSRKGIEQIKAFISARSDTIRPKYGRETEDRRRSCIFIGTTNDDSFLVDITGNRRYLPVEVAETEPTVSVFDDAAASGYIEQCWAEAFAANGDALLPLVVPRGVSEQAEQAQSRHMEDDPLIGMIGAYLDGVANGSLANTKRVCAMQIADEAVGVDDARAAENRQLLNRIRTIMREDFPQWKRTAGPVNTGTKFGKQRCWDFVPAGCEGAVF